MAITCRRGLRARLNTHPNTPSKMKTLATLLLALLLAPSAYAGDCATGVTENTSHVLIDSMLVANSGLLPGDRILAIWQDASGVFRCAGQSGPYVPGVSFAIHPVSGERIGGGIAVTIWMDDILHNDPLDWPFGTSISLVVERSGEWFLTLAVSDGMGPLCSVVGKQPWPHTGGEQFFCVSDFLVTIVVDVEDGPGLTAAPYPNPSYDGLLWISRPRAFIVYDGAGRRVRKGFGIQIDLSSLPAGVYLIWSEGQTYPITLQH